MLILSEGMQTSIQDLGRKGFRSYGVPISGAMDKYSAILANKLLNNQEDAPVMEMCVTGPKILFEDLSWIAVTGADISPMLNGEPINRNMVYRVNTSDVLSFGPLKSGVRAYLAVKGGFQTEKVLGSYAYHEGITKHARVLKGQRLQIANLDQDIEMTSAKIKVKESHFKSRRLEVTKGPEYSRLSKEQREKLFKMSFRIDKMNNRMGYQLKSRFPSLKDSEIITSVTIPGTVQLTPSGRMIILMRDCPTTGGYARILQLNDMAINQLAQKKQDDVFKFDLESSFEFLGRLVSRFRDSK